MALNARTGQTVDEELVGTVRLGACGNGQALLTRVGRVIS